MLCAFCYATVCNKTFFNSLKDDPETIIAITNLDCKEEMFASAIEKYKIERQIMGNSPMLLCHIASCSYRVRDHEVALEVANEMISTVVNEKETSLLE